MEVATKQPFLGMTREEVEQAVKTLGMPSFTARQICSWLYVKRVMSIDEMTNISLRHRALLNEHYCVGAVPPVEAQRAADGTVKYLFRIADKGYVEGVSIPDGERATLCVSSQVGCKMHCSFCMTGRQGFHGNLTAAEILNQVYAIPESATLTNVVMMGMGEPLDNLDAVMRSLAILTADYGWAWSPKRITLSTVGIRRGLRRFLEESDCHLAVSLHNPYPDERAAMMPAEQAFSIQEIVETLRSYDFAHQRRLSFEYTMFRDKNDTPLHAKAIVKLLRGLECRINLIRYHAIPDSPLCGSDEQRMIAFRDYLTQHGIFTTIRASRGEEIFAACGMLSGTKQ